MMNRCPRITSLSTAYLIDGVRCWLDEVVHWIVPLGSVRIAPISVIYRGP
jgi:hypothetical protein